MAEAPKPWRRGGAGLVIMLRLTPGAPRDAIEGVEAVPGGVALKARVRARPEKGKANAAAEKLLGEWLGVPPSSVRLKSGGASRLKALEVTGDPDALAAVIQKRLAADSTATGKGRR